MPPIAVDTRGDVISTMHTVRREAEYIPLMARSSMLYGMNDWVKHAYTIGYSIPTVTGLINSAALAIGCEVVFGYNIVYSYIKTNNMGE